MMATLQGAKCYLVPFEVNHMNDEEYLGWLRDYDVVKTINRLDYLRPVSFEEVRRYCESVMQSPQDIFMAIHEVASERFIGTIRASRIDLVTRTADIGILIGEKDVWGKGFGTDAISTLAEYLFDRLCLRKLTAGLMAVNPGMLRVFEKLGFRQEGVFREQDYFEGKYVDHIYLGCFRDEFKKLGAEQPPQRGRM